MVAGGGHADAPVVRDVLRRPGLAPGSPVPIFQALEDFAVYLVLIAIERRLDRWPNGTRRVGYPPGIVLGTGMVLWGIERSVDEHLWLGEDGRLGSDLVQAAGILLVAAGVVILVRTRVRWREWLRTHDGEEPAEATGTARSDGAHGSRRATHVSER